MTFGRHGTLVGILTEPTVVSKIPIVILGAGILHRVGPSRYSVVLARTLARTGHPVLRFDLSGIGDSARSPETNLRDTAVSDINDAIGVALGAGAEPSTQVSLIGFCSGADNAFYVAIRDSRVASIVLFDPTVHRTWGFRFRDAVRRLRSPRAWWNVLSGRSIQLRLAARASSNDAARAPDHYGLLVAGQQEANLGSESIGRGGANLLFVLSSGAHSYCNSSRQVRESLPRGYATGRLEVAWMPEIDHVLSRSEHQERLTNLIEQWFAKTAAASSIPR